MNIFETNIVTDSLEKLRALGKLDLDLKHRGARQEGRNRFVVPGILNAAEIKKAKAAGYKVNIIDDLSEMLDARKREVSRVNRFLTARRVPDMATRSVEGYLTADEVEDALVNLSTENPDLVEIIELPNRTWEDRVSHAVRVGSIVNSDQTTVLFTGSMHAREWGGADICVSFLINLIKAFKEGDLLQFGGKVFSVDQVRSIIDNLKALGGQVYV